MTPDTATAVLEVDLAAVVANWRTLRARHPAGAVAAVVKADGYGLGAREIAPALYSAGCRHFFVAVLEEALAIRPLLPGAMIAVLGGLVPGTEPVYRAHDITPVLGSLTEIDAWAGTARAADAALPAILHVDSGMARLGLDARELATLAADHGRLRGLVLRYLMTHLVSSEVADDPMNETQRRRFLDACAVLPPAPCSVANSSGLFRGDAFAFDLGRPGAALYGINPTPDQPNPMCPAVCLRVRVLSVREIPAGASVGYNATWHAPRPSRIATAALGYADGWHRSLSGRGRAFFDGEAVPLVGRVSMDLTTFDATDHPRVQPGTWLELLGPHQRVDDVAAQAGTNGYEVLTSLGRRFARIYKPA